MVITWCLDIAYSMPARLSKLSGSRPVRLERRLAALLQDLAKHKRMSVGGCLEEMLLKQKHGIDYDSHASYRFVED
jgi:hypothetical protein